MGFCGISIWQLVIVLIIIILLFGTKKLRSLGGDLGSAIKNFKHSVREGEDTNDNADSSDNAVSHNDDSVQSTSNEHDKHSS